jgi:hypothetical protein
MYVDCDCPATTRSARGAPRGKTSILCKVIDLVFPVVIAPKGQDVNLPGLRVLWEAAEAYGGGEDTALTIWLDIGPAPVDIPGMDLLVYALLLGRWWCLRSMELSYTPNNPAEDGTVFAGVVAPEEAEAMRSFIDLRSYRDGYKGSAGKGCSIDAAQHTMQELGVALGLNDDLHPCPFNLTADRYQQELSSSRFSAAAAYFCMTNPGELLKQRSLSPLGEFRARIGIEGFDNTVGLPRGIPLAEFFPKKRDTVTDERVSSVTRAAAELLSGPRLPHRSPSRGKISSPSSLRGWRNNVGWTPKGPGGCRGGRRARVACSA